MSNQNGVYRCCVFYGAFSGSRNYGALHNEHYILCIVMSITTPSLISAFASNTRQDLRPLVAIAIADKLTANVIRHKP